MNIVKVSYKWANHPFACCKEYIENNCHGRCCVGKDKLLVCLLPEEEKQHIRNGCQVKNGLLQGNLQTGLCPYKMPSGLCSVHGTNLKPFGCVASPFTLNKSETLIIRHRYSLMKCHGIGKPAYVTFRESLNLIFGLVEAARVCKELEKRQTDVEALISVENYNRLLYLDNLKRTKNEK